MSEPNAPTPADGPPQPAQPLGWGSGYAQPLGYGPPPGQAPPTPPAAPQYGTPQYGAPQYGAPQYGAPQYGAPQYAQGQYGASQYGAPQYGAPQYGAPQYGAPAGYVPPPVQRGVVPLRPLSLGEIYDGAFRSVRANPRVMFGFSAVLVAGACLIGGLLWYLLIPTLSSWLGSVESDLNTTGSTSTFDTTDSLASALGMYALLPFVGLATIVLNGVLTISVSRSVIGQKVTVAELWGRHWRRVLVLVGLTLLIGVAAVLAWVLFVVLVVAIASASGAMAVLVGIVGGLAMVVAGVWVTVRMLLVPPVLMLEDKPVWASVARAWRLTRGSFWRLLGINLLAQVIVSIASQVLTFPTSLIAAIFITDTSSGGYVAAMTVAMAISYALPTVFLAAVVALQYIDVRIRKEGLDVQLSRAAEAAAQHAGAL